MRGPQWKIYIYIYIQRDREEREREREGERDYDNVSQLFLPASGLDTTKDDETCHELWHPCWFCQRKLYYKPPAVVADTGRKDD